MNWPQYRLSQLADRFISGGTPSTRVEEHWHGDIPWITGGDFSNGEVILGRRYINQVAVDNSATNVVPKGSILVVTRTGVGKIAIAPVDIAISQDITGIVLKRGLSSEYVTTAIRHKMSVLLSAQRGATIKGVTRKDVENLSIPMPPPSEQRRIVEILDQADALRKKRAEADKKAARILPALFYQMFGDPVTNPKGWDRIKLRHLLRQRKGSIQSGPFGSNLHNSDFVPEGKILAVGIDNVHDTGFQLGRERRITEEKYAQLKKYTLEAGDVLITIMGTVGRTCVFPEWGGKAICTKHVYRIKTNADRLKPEYLSACIRFSSAVRSQLGSSITGQIVKAITSKDLYNLVVDVPPPEIQGSFVSAKQKLDSQREEQMRSTAKLDRLFGSIMHRAFSGDLTAKWREAHMGELLQEMEEQAKALA